MFARTQIKAEEPKEEASSGPAEVATGILVNLAAEPEKEAVVPPQDQELVSQAIMYSCSQ